MNHHPLLSSNVLSLGVLLAALQYSPFAGACGGLSSAEQLTIPNSDSQPVSVDSLPLVIGGTRELTLRSEDGTTVPIAVINLGQVQPAAVFAEAPPHVQHHSVRQLIPAQDLLPSTQYEVFAGRAVTDQYVTADAGVTSAEEIGRFTTAASAASSSAASIPSDFKVTYYSFGAGDDANCSGSGQIEFSGWQDNTLLELCIDYFTYTRYVDPTFADEINSDESPKRQTVCTLAWQPFAFVLEEVEPVLWVESVQVKALGRDGSKSAPLTLGKNDFEQFTAVIGGEGLAVEPLAPLIFSSSETEPEPETQTEEPVDDDNVGNNNDDMASSAASSNQATAPASPQSGGCSMSVPSNTAFSWLLPFGLLLSLRRRQLFRIRQ